MLSIRSVSESTWTLRANAESSTCALRTLFITHELEGAGWMSTECHTELIFLHWRQKFCEKTDVRKWHEYYWQESVRSPLTLSQIWQAIQSGVLAQVSP